MDDRTIALGAALFIALGVWAASRLYRRWLARGKQPTAQLEAIGLPADGRPVVLGFTGEYCLPCKTQQHPALERLRSQVGEAAHVEEVDALEHAELAGRYGVLTVPTTVVLDDKRGVVAINYGVTPAEKLYQQVQPYLKQFAHA
jgi:thioredoxin 1